MRTPGSTDHSKTLLACSLLAAGFLLTGLGGCSKPRPLTPEEQLQSSVENLRTVLKDTVKDPVRLTKLLAKLDEGAMLLRLQAAAEANLLARQHHLDLNYNATRKDFQAVGEQLALLKQKSFDQSMAIRSAMAGLATDEEWKKVTSKNLGLLGF
jgi:hypothetical protein